MNLSEAGAMRALAVVVIVTPLATGCVAPWNWDECPDTNTDGVLPDGATVERRNGGWEARQTIERTWTPGALVDIDLDVRNGPIAITAGGDDARLVVEAWGRNGDRDGAIACLVGLELDVATAAGSVRVDADGPSHWGSGERGASVRLELPAGTVVTGVADTSNGRVDITDLAVRQFEVDTSNGPVRLLNVTARNLEVDTSNGPITGELRVAGDVTMDTSNGRLDLALTPTDRTHLMLDTSNGHVSLQLAESADVGYSLVADTSNGHVRVDMADAVFSGDEDGGTVQTTGHASRPIRVTGVVDTSNGDVVFDGV